MAQFIPDLKDRDFLRPQVKKISRFETMSLEEAVVSAIRQIEDKNYAQELFDRGVHRILYLGLAFEGKKVLIRHKFRE